MRNNLDRLLEDGILDEVLGRLQGGKEADVFRVRYRGEEVAAKVYKDRQQRSFKHNSAYKEGRKVRNSRTQRAIDKGSRFGRDEAEDAWKASEATTLHLLHGHGVRVPTPVLFYDGVLLMQLVMDADGDDAPRLIDAPIDPEHAGALYRDVRSQIIGMLCCDLIHGDLSPYNVLLGAEGPTIIDFPQTLSAAHNSQSERFFHRDYDNILRFFAGLDRRLNAHGGDAREIWRAYARRELTPDFVPSSAARQYRPPPQPAAATARPPQGDPRPPQGDRRGPRPWAPHAPRPQGPPFQRSQAPHVQRQPAPRVHPQPAPPVPAPRPDGPPPRRGRRRSLQGPAYGAPARSSQRPAPQVVVYVKRRGPLDPPPRPEDGPPQSSQTSQPRGAPPERVEARRERGRRR